MLNGGTLRTHPCSLIGVAATNRLDSLPRPVRHADRDNAAAAPERGQYANLTATAAPDPAHSRLTALHTAINDHRLRILGAHASRPLLDIVIEATTAEKLDALSLIAKRYTPAFAPALRKALEDADGSVRVLAATVMAQLNNDHTRHIGALQNTALAAPTGASWRALAEARLAYAASGLLDADRAQREADEGRACLARADALEAENGVQEMIGHAALKPLCRNRQRSRPMSA